MIIDYEAMGRRIRRRRLERGYTQRALAECVNLSVSYYGHIERGTRIPSIETIVLLANELLVSTDYFLRDSLKAPVQIAKNPLFSNKDLHMLRAYLNAQQDAIDHWLDDDTEPSSDTEEPLNI